MSKHLAATLLPHNTQILTELETAVKTNLLLEGGVAGSPPKTTELAEKLCSLWFAFLDQTIEAADIKADAVWLFEQGLTYTAAAKSLQSLRQTSVTLTAQDPSLKLELLSAYITFSEMFLAEMMIGQTSTVIQQQEQPLKVPQQILTDKLDHETDQAQWLALRERRLQGIYAIDVRMADVATQAELFKQFVDLAYTHLALVGLVVFELSADKQAVIAREQAGTLPRPLTLNQSQTFTPNSPFDQVINHHQIVVAPLDDPQSPANTETMLLIGSPDNPLGVLALWLKESDLQNEDLEFTRILASKLAATWRNIQLVEQIQHQAQREQIVREITAKMQKATTLQQLLKTTAEALNSHFAAEYTLIEMGAEHGNER